MCSRRLKWIEACGPGFTTEPRGLTESRSRPADLLATATVPGRSALDVCVPSSNAAAARGDAAQAAFDRKLSHYRQQNTSPPWSGQPSPSLVWTDGRPHPAVTRTVCRHRIQPQRPTDVDKITSLMETRNPDRPSAKSSHDAGSPRVQAPKLGATMTTTQTQGQGQTPPYLMTKTTTSPLSPANKPHQCSNQDSSCARLLPGAARSLSL